MGIAEEMLDHATLLIEFDLPNDPKQVNLRRSVSAAYYALFHLLTIEASSNWRHERHRHRFARFFDHGRMKNCCIGLPDRLRKHMGKTPSDAETQIASHLKYVAATFVRLQEERHLADYDHSEEWSRSDAYQMVSIAKAAVEAWTIVSDTAIAQDFLLDLLAK